jgi:hypothetical protein
VFVQTLLRAGASPGRGVGGCFVRMHIKPAIIPRAPTPVDLGVCVTLTRGVPTQTRNLSHQSIAATSVSQLFVTKKLRSSYVCQGPHCVQRKAGYWFSNLCFY